MPFETAQSLRVAVKEADDAIRQAVLAGDILDVMLRLHQVIVSLFFIFCDK